MLSTAKRVGRLLRPEGLRLAEKGLKFGAAAQLTSDRRVHEVVP